MCMDYKNEYAANKTVYLYLIRSNCQTGGSKSWSKQQKILIKNLHKKIPTLLLKNNTKDTQQLIERFVSEPIGDIEEKIKDKFMLTEIVKSFDYRTLLFFNKKFNVVRANDSPNMNIKKINEYIDDENLILSYSFTINNNVFHHEDEYIYGMQSVGKIFTGMMVMFMLKEEILTENDLNEPIQLSKRVLSKLSPKVKDKIYKTTLLDTMTHKTGILDYLPKYVKTIKTSLNDGTVIPDPTNPEDFLIYADENVIDSPQYSNLGILLVGLSIEHLHNVKNTKMTYNDMLEKYIIGPANLKTFSIKNPNTIKVKYSEVDNYTRYLNGSPAGGYWMSCNDLRKFGEWCKYICNTNKDIHNCVVKYGDEFYDSRYDVIMHSGGLGTTTTQLTAYLKKNLIISIMSCNDKNADVLNKALYLYK